MPYAPLPRPSLSLGLLKAVLDGAGIATAVAYPSLWFAEEVGVRPYYLCSRLETEVLAGEWTFAEAAFRDAAPAAGPYLREAGPHWIMSGFGHLLGSCGNGAESLPELLLALRRAAGAFVDRAARRVLATGARLVGCSSSFEQHAPSLALLRRVREIDPSVLTMLGGANCEGVMGRATHRAFPWVDYVVSGDADGLIADLCRLVLAAGREVPAAELPAGVFGPVHRSAPSAAGMDPQNAPRAVARDLDSLPVPDFGDYFRTLDGSSIAGAIRPALPLETSRGCWWGAVRHCTFCGLNGTSMGYRSKSPDRVLAEIRALEERYGIASFEAVDNILDMAFFKTVLPRLAEEAEGEVEKDRRRFFYEVKPNLQRSQVETLRRAGVIWIQPGIESFSSAALAKMDKGVQGWQNVQLLRWSREIGVRVSWQFLWGIPGEDDGWYAALASWLPALEHLEAPMALTRIRFDRYSVYHERPESFGLTLRPLPSMRHVYPLPEADLHALGYYFEAEGRPALFSAGEDDRLEGRPGVRALDAAVTAWRAAFRRRPRPVLLVTDDGVTLRLRDTRRCAPRRRVRLTGLDRAVYLCCEEAHREETLAAAVERHGLTVTDADVAAAAARLEQGKLLLRLDGRLLSLGLRGPLPKLPHLRDLPNGVVRLREGARYLSPSRRRIAGSTGAFLPGGT